MRTVALGLATAAVISLASSYARADSHGAAGTWIMDNGKITVRVIPCGDDLCGKIVGIKKPLDKKGRPKRDKHNPNPALRDRPVIGLTIMANMKADGEGRWSGEIYNPDDGNTYASYIRLDDGQMKVNGCVAFICEKITFRRVE